MIAFLRLVPSWIWITALLVALLTGVGLWWGESRHRDGKDEVRAEWDASLARGYLLQAQKEAEYRAQEHRHAADMARIERESKDKLTRAGDEAYNRAIADVRAGRLRGPWQCPAAPNVPGPGGAATERPSPSDDREHAVARVLRIGAEADQRLLDCQAVIAADRAKP